MAYVPIVKLDNFISEEDNAQVWLNNVEKAIAANRWNDIRAIQVILYFFKDTANLCNNNSINHLVNTFTTMKQEETEAVTTYLGRFYRNLCQIQAIDANYFTAPQILNQFIYSLCSSILQHVCLLHPDILPDAVTCTRDFKLAESETNHAQAINLVMNESSELDSKLKQFSDSINQKLEGYLANNHAIYQPLQRCSNSENYNHSQNQRCVSVTTMVNKGTSEQTAMLIITRTISKHLPANDAAANLPNTSISDSNLSTAATHNISTTTTNNLSTPINSDTILKFRLCSQNSGISATQNLNSQNYLSLLVIPENATTNHLGSNQQQALTNNIPPATLINDESLAAIFPFNLKETIKIPLFSGAALEEKPITTMYMNVKIDGHAIKLILDSGSASSIITRQLMNQLGYRVD
ncbi:hypothetical protein G9A89_010125 [Geosiphon pyriformis]|nr:hypothetical protein G9A89_010125 [Geosiphon pyriformis]